MTPSPPAQAEASETVEQMVKRLLPETQLNIRNQSDALLAVCNAVNRYAEQHRPGVAAALESERDSRDRLGNALAELVSILEQGDTSEIYGKAMRAAKAELAKFECTECHGTGWVRWMGEGNQELSIVCEKCDGMLHSFVRFIEPQTDSRDSLQAEVERLRLNLRSLAIVQHVRMAHEGGTVPNGRHCKICGSAWDQDAPETHATTCALTPGEKS